ncbi:hypothetical protein COCSADRAFT_164265 [Bipolaris sorokiniana ND90Pr]|uniref:Rhodopsin domain-containing protein n=1 Tax=Cochliobolus sativus (strain ND90Pr / ATCC 201652) TaxID=665912 RepID=M2SCD9_COCSN|nr:uncharacterized protein COCSADRAFT_164265 [Bipolaris sorokiniana ND90Pr]EMD60130.1 hypothetical protein COCSADRAFT_164265 [Bipolaris sorokiniana ND90Pr]
MNHNYSKDLMIGLAIAFAILPTFFVSLRIWAKRISKRIGWDDFLTLGALAVCLTCCFLQLATAIHGYLGAHQPLDENGQPIMDDPGLIFFEETKFAINMISIVGLGLVKSSILILYKTIFDVRKFRICVYIVLAYVVAWTISFTFSHLFTCYPITVFIEPYYGNSCVETVPMFLALLYTDVLADLAILFLPIPMVMSVRMQMKRKIAVIVMLSLGAAVCAVSITRVVATYSIAKEYIKHPDDVVYYTAPVFFWTNIELSLGLVCACLPTLRPIWFFFYPKEETRTGYGYGYGSSGRGYGSSGLHGTKNSSFSAKLARKPYQSIDEMELTTRSEEILPPPVEHDSSSSTDKHGIRKEVTIHQTLE